MTLGSRTDLIRAGALLALGAVLAIIIVLWLGGEGVIEKILTIKPGYFLLAITIQIAYTLIWSLRWALIVHAQGQRVPYEIIPITFSGAFFNNITPVSKTGGEPIRGYLMGKATDTSFEEGMASVIVDRIFDMVPFILICLGTFMLVFMYNLAGNPWLLLIILFGLVTSTAFSALFIYGSQRKETGFKVVLFFINKLEPLIKRFRSVDDLKERTEQALDRFYDGISCISKNRRLLIVCLLTSFLLWALVVLRLKVVFLSLGCTQSLLIVNIVAVAMVFAGFIPFLPGGLVVTEGVMILLFTGLGVKGDISGSAVLVDRIVSFWFMILVGAITSLYLGIKLKVLDWKNEDG